MRAQLFEITDQSTEGVKPMVVAALEKVKPAERGWQRGVNSPGSQLCPL